MRTPSLGTKLSRRKWNSAHSVPPISSNIFALLKWQVHVSQNGVISSIKMSQVFRNKREYEAINAVWRSKDAWSHGGYLFSIGADCGSGLTRPLVARTLPPHQSSSHKSRWYCFLPPPGKCHPLPPRCTAMMAAKYLGLWGQISSSLDPLTTKEVLYLTKQLPSTCRMSHMSLTWKLEKSATFIKCVTTLAPATCTRLETNLTFVSLTFHQELRFPHNNISLPRFISINAVAQRFIRAYTIFFETGSRLVGGKTEEPRLVWGKNKQRHRQNFKTTHLIWAKNPFLNTRASGFSEAVSTYSAAPSRKVAACVSRSLGRFSRLNGPLFMTREFLTLSDGRPLLPRLVVGCWNFAPL